MTFNSLQYFVFFAVVVAVYFRLDRRGQNRLMVVAGSVFYGAFDWRFLGLLWVSILVDFTIGNLIQATDDEARRKRLFLVSVAVQLGILGFFKYAGFFADSVRDVFDRLGLEADFFTLEVLLPVGISFYTFQSLAYVRAVYRREVEAERDLVDFAAFVSWFPQLVAGPIERASALLPQVQRRREKPPAAVIESGIALILQGLFKKVVLADSVAAYVTAVYGQPGRHSWFALGMATVGFAVQVYGDFSGYTDIARGTSRILGVELRRNFEQPFLSRDIQELWRRWHTSLSAWFLDFVATPMTSSRYRFSPTAVVVTMFTLIGLWHGAAWTFVFWGFLNGVLVAAWRTRPTPPGRHPMKLRWREVPAIGATFALFCFGAVFFRAGSLGDAVDVLRGIVTVRDGGFGPSSGWLVPVMLALLVAIDLAERRQRIRAIELVRVRAVLGAVCSPAEAVVESPSRAAGPVLVGSCAGLFLLGIVLFSGGVPTPFVYFQF